MTCLVKLQIKKSEIFKGPGRMQKYSRNYHSQPTRDDSLTTISEDSIADGSMSKYDSLDRTPKVSTVSGYGTTSKRRISKVESIV